MPAPNSDSMLKSPPMIEISCTEHFLEEAKPAPMPALFSDRRVNSPPEIVIDPTRDLPGALPMAAP
jgi:hypothetical protein